MLHRLVKHPVVDSQHAFPSQGQIKPEQIEIDQLRKEVVSLKAEYDILKKAVAYFAKGAIRKLAFVAKRRTIWPVDGGGIQGGHPKLNDKKICAGCALQIEFQLHCRLWNDGSGVQILQCTDINLSSELTRR